MRLAGDGVLFGLVGSMLDIKLGELDVRVVPIRLADSPKATTAVLRSSSSPALGLEVSAQNSAEGDPGPIVQIVAVTAEDASERLYLMLLLRGSRAQG